MKEEVETFNMASNLFRTNFKNPPVDQGSKPYQLFSFSNYFGELEILLDACPRISTARCESEDGSLLVVHKRELYSLMEEFPHLASQWRHDAHRRVGIHEKMRAELDPTLCYRGLAARTVQRARRYILARRKGELSQSPEYFRQLVETSSIPKAKKMVPIVEVVPQYARAMQAHIDGLTADVHKFRDHLSSEVQEIKALLRANTLPQRVVENL